MNLIRISASLSKGLRIALAMLMLSGVSFAATMTYGLFTAQEAQAAPRRVRRACRSDYKRLCPRYRAGTSRMRSCMRANGSQLSWRCYEALRDHGYVRGRGRSSRRGRRRGRRRY